MWGGGGGAEGRAGAGRGNRDGLKHVSPAWAHTTLNVSPPGPQMQHLGV